MGLAVGAGFLGVVLGAFGFVANEAQSDTSLMGIRLMFSILPAALAILGAMFIFFYRIDVNTIRQMEEELRERHALTAASA
jgi:GPH family glycoside/pentoside/hexuronide:cation symporter